MSVKMKKFLKFFINCAELNKKVLFFEKLCVRIWKYIGGGYYVRYETGK